MILPRALPVSHGTLLGPFRAGLGAGGGPAASVQPAGPLTLTPERAPPWTGKMAQRPQLPSRAGGRGLQAASCVLSTPAPQTPSPQLALWALRAAWQAALTVCPGCHWPSPQTPELGRALGAAGRPCPPSGPFLVLPAAVCPLLSVSGLSPARTSSLHRRWASALCLCWLWGGGGPIFVPTEGTVSARCHWELGRRGPGSLPRAGSQSPSFCGGPGPMPLGARWAGGLRLWKVPSEPC